MATKFLTNLDLNQNQLVNASFEIVGSDPGSNNFEGRLIYNSTEDTIKVYSGSAWRKMLHAVQASGSYTDALSISESNGTISLTLNLADTDSAGLLSSTFWNMLNDATDAATASKLAKRDGNGNLKVAEPTDPAHAATKAYVDAARSGLDVKQSVRAATTGPLTIATDLEAGDTLDTTVTLVAGDRVLVKNQSTASENGIYVVQASGAAVRATDFDSAGEVSGGAFTFVEEGTAYADSGWVVTSNGSITVGTDPISWAQFSGAGQITAGAGLTKTGNTIDAVGTADRITVNADSIDIASTYAGQSSIVTLGTVTTGTWNGTTIAIANGGTGATDAATARDNLGVEIGVDVQAYNATLAAVAGGTYSGDDSITTVGTITSGTWNGSTIALANGGTGATDAATARDNLGVEIGVDVQAYNATLAAVAGGTYTGDDSITTLGTITTGTWNGTKVAIAVGGTAASTASAARENLAAGGTQGVGVSTPVLARTVAYTLDGSATSYVVQHGLGTRDVQVQVYSTASPYETVFTDVERTDTNNVTIKFASAPADDAYRVVITG